MFPTVSDCFHFSDWLIGPIPCMEGWSSANPCKPWRWSFSVWPLCAYTAPNVASWPWYPIISPKNPKIPGACEIWYNYIYIYFSGDISICWFQNLLKNQFFIAAPTATSRHVTSPDVPWSSQSPSGWCQPRWCLLVYKAHEPQQAGVMVVNGVITPF